MSSENNLQSPPSKPLQWHPTDKQTEALIYLQDKETTEVFFGGGAGGGKSHLGCFWLLSNASMLQNTRWVMARSELKALKQSTLLRFFEVAAGFGMLSDRDFKYNSVEGVIKILRSGSEIYLRELAANPSDPEFDKLGSTEYTGAFIDEGSQVSVKGKNILASRLRYRLEEYDLIPKLLIASNPTKNFLYYDFYKPWKEKKLPVYRKVVQALATDNRHISPFYIENLKRQDEITKQRLLFGNWEYDDDDAKLMTYGQITDIFTLLGQRTGEKFISVDVARYGSDSVALVVWDGFSILEIATMQKKSTPETEQFIESKRAKWAIGRSHVVVDEDGVGGGVVDHLPGVVGFVNGSSALQPPGSSETANYRNLKTQCYFILADKVKAGMVGCYKSVLPEHKRLLIEDLEQIRRKNMDKDGKLEIESKEEIKERIGRSPDLGDAVMMRMRFEIIKPTRAMVLGVVPEDRASGLPSAQDLHFYEHLYSRE